MTGVDDVAAVELIDDLDDARRTMSSVVFDDELYARTRDFILDAVADNQRLNTVLAHRTAQLDRLTLRGHDAFRDDAIGRGQRAVDQWNHQSDEMSLRQILRWAENATDVMTQLLAVVRREAVVTVRGLPVAPIQDDEHGAIEPERAGA